MSPGPGSQELPQNRVGPIKDGPLEEPALGLHLKGQWEKLQRKGAPAEESTTCLEGRLPPASQAGPASWSQSFSWFQPFLWSSMLLVSKSLFSSLWFLPVPVPVLHSYAPVPV